jgi:proteasome lid subunit RPN8/RPN11
MVTFPPEALRVAIAHCEAAYPNEGCGVFIEEREGAIVARPMVNAIDRYHARDPARFPRTARTAYMFEPREQLEVFDGAEVAGARVVAIFHSHADVGAYFSDEDRHMALAEGKPLLPGVDYVVISIRRRADDLLVFRWSNGDFICETISLP